MTLKLLLGLLLVLITGTGVYHSFKPMPNGLAMEGKSHPLVEPRLLTDRTQHYGDESPRLDHEIFDEALDMIAQARSFILVDMFLYNSTHAENGHRRRLAQELTDALIQQREEHPDMDIVVISDPINTMYGGTESPHFKQLRQAGIQVTLTELPQLRDSNPLWSSIWRLCCQWFGNASDSGWLPNPIGEEPVTVRSYLSLLNFKANHRKVIVSDTEDGLKGLVSTANPHDGSSRHSNIGLSFKGPAVADLLRSERAVLVMSGISTQAIDKILTNGLKGADPVGASIRVLTESAIRDSALDMIRTSESGDRVDLAMFYLSHRDIITSLVQASRRGVDVRVLLDANHDAFGREKSGVPNRQAALDLTRGNVTVRWCNTRGEQCHSKLLIRQDQGGKAQILLGSANFTRRNLDNLNLETSVHLATLSMHPVVQKTSEFFDEQWNNGPGSEAVMSLPYKAWADDSTLRYWQYRLMEATGLSTF